MSDEPKIDGLYGPRTIRIAQEAIRLAQERVNTGSSRAVGADTGCGRG